MHWFWEMGRGLFIGMRIGASVAQGIAYGAGLKIVPVSSLAAVAADAMAQENASIAVAQDARMNEVYLGLFHRSDSGLPISAAEEAIFPADKINAFGDIQWLAAGAAWQHYTALQERNAQNIAGQTDIYYPKARYLLAIAVESLRSGSGIAPEDLPACLSEDTGRDATQGIASLFAGGPTREAYCCT